jgi:replication factor C small subunit
VISPARSAVVWAPRIAAGDVLADVLAEVRSRQGGERAARVHRLAGDVEADLQAGTTDRVHLARLLAELGEA